jgi:hypothetical protein
MAGIIKVGRLLSSGGGATTVAPPVPGQDTGNQTTTNAISDTATFASSTTTGNGVIVCLALKGGRRVSTLTDNKGNTYVRVGFVVDVSDAVAEIWYAQSITGGASHTLTVTYDAAAYVVWGAIEVSRIKGSGFLDARTVATFARAGAGSSASVSVTSGVPRSTNEMFVAMLALAGGGADAGIDTPSNWTAITQFNNYDSIMAGHGAYRINGNATALTATWTNDTTTAPAAAIIAAFRAQNAISAGVNPPVNSVAPAITGTPTEGETLTASTGTWSNSPDSYTYQWKDDGVAISAATASTYVLTASEVGATITVTVTAHNEGSGSTGVSATSAGVGPVAAGIGGPDILDDVTAPPTGVFSAYRRMLSSYSGSLIRVSRSSDSTEQDIGVGADGLLDTSALTTFVGASTGSVVKVYDQSGNGRDFGNATPTNAPQIVVSGTLQTLNSHPAPTTPSGNTTRWLESAQEADAYFSTTAYTWIGIARLTEPTTGGATTDGHAIFGDVDGGPSLHIFDRSGDTQLEINQYDGTQRNQAANVSGYPVNSVCGARFGGGSVRAFADGSSEGTVASGAIGLTSGTNMARLFRARFSAGTAGFLAGAILEAVYFNTALSNTDMNTLGEDMAFVAGTTWTTVAW